MYIKGKFNYIFDHTLIHIKNVKFIKVSSLYTTLLTLKRRAHFLYHYINIKASLIYDYVIV